MKNKKFNPLLFLMSLGAGGIAVLPFVLMQYTVDHGKGLITRSQLWSNHFTFSKSLYYSSLEAIMIIFAIIHLTLTIILIRKLIKYLKNKDYKEIINNPLKNTALLPPIISIAMTMNVFIGVIRYFSPWVQNNFQAMFIPAFIFWLGIYIVLVFLK